jgi:hypothetical protein
MAPCRFHDPAGAVRNVLGLVLGIDRREVSIKIDWQDDGPRLYGLKRRLEVALVGTLSRITTNNCSGLRTGAITSAFRTTIRCTPTIGTAEVLHKGRRNLRCTFRLSQCTRCDPRKASHPDCRRLRAVGSARAGADDPGPSKGRGNNLASSDCPHVMHEAADRKRNGKAIACTFGDTVGSFPDLVRPTLLCACKQPVIPYIRLHHA